jgi:rod shape-determining protein MreD
VLLIIEANLFRVSDFFIHQLARFGFLPNLVSASVPALAFPIVIFMGVREYPLLLGTFSSFLIGYLTDVFGTAPVGLYTTVYTGTFLLARSSGLRLAAQTRWMQMLITLGFAVVKSALVLGLIAILGKDTWLPKKMYYAILPHSVTTAICAIFVFGFADRIHIFASQSRSEGTA